ncbi:tRNA 2-thiouridine-synthesizing protein [Pseudoalteromonas sp. JBTF-M23]|uniref:tRNA 2-thiouridine-synthesizing protein n=1 Tax=Pseudoalteromonas caenipelagi TaxID=2726988 RepID=A0A849VC73_9GAMM|nr:tRNA 2-thiouridine-synthesizing protein [Pseudoalteromonas caenipelagi]NOU49387.1 tRNA 2-thiouridine-synthesizing protein [Pseudoalteromonas caenipelagi]
MSIDTVHIFSKPVSYYQKLQIEQLLAHNDAVLLTGDACYDHISYSQFSANLYMLTSCAIARGVSTDSGYTLCCDNEWVNLINSAKKSITW